METVEDLRTKRRQQSYIGDIMKCKDRDAYQKAFERLLRDLKVR